MLADDAPNIDCDYPSSVPLSDGRVLTVYYQVEDLAKARETATARSFVWTPPCHSAGRAAGPKD